MFGYLTFRASRRMLLGVILTAGLSAGRLFAGSVLPPTAQPHGYTLTDMAAAVANFSISGNDPAYYPDTPFQILYRQHVQDPTGANTFHVKPGTYVYVKFFFIDDSAPVIGNFPADAGGAPNYVFGPDQLGGHDLEVEVDGKVTSLDDAGYVAGPVPTPTSPDGSAHLIQLGAFLSPLSKGTHQIVIRGTFDGDAFVAFVGGPIDFQITYTVVVET